MLITAVTRRPTLRFLPTGLTAWSALAAGGHRAEWGGLLGPSLSPAGRWPFGLMKEGCDVAGRGDIAVSRYWDLGGTPFGSRPRTGNVGGTPSQ